MTRSKSDRNLSSKQKIPRIRSSEAAEILERCGQILQDSRQLLAELQRKGFDELLRRFDDKILQLAVQADEWGERARACLIAEIAPALVGGPDPEEAVTLEQMTEVANIVAPCFLLEIGRRRKHIHVELPPDPMEAGSLILFRAGPSSPVRFLGRRKLLDLTAVAGEALVSLCYFGDPESRDQVEAELTYKSGKARRCRKRGRSNIS